MVLLPLQIHGARVFLFCEGLSFPPALCSQGLGIWAYGCVIVSAQGQVFELKPSVGQSSGALGSLNRVVLIARG